MSDLNVTPQGWFQYLLGAVVTLIAGIFEHYRRRFEKISDTYVSNERLRETLESIDDSFEKMREERREMHAENSKRLDRIYDRLDDLADR